ncbi:HAD-IIIA family hydrolase [Clostridium hydrogenum]|uniref:HAD-IIIA family hydrolase n=1 Tax=Clostridium hydrogenum TaxID=2855764 RepID=UPI001F44F1E5|nr:HAD-IIIA family hydrolase [Clostridium hydrogenum]
MKNKIKTVFIDRDGTMGGGSEVIYPGDFELYSFTKEAFKILKAHKVKIFAFTNQPGISLGKATIGNFLEELLGFGVDNAYICPHSPKEHCNCRKPETGLLLKASEEYKLNFSECMVIGDRLTDMQAAEKVEAHKILVETGVGSDSLKANEKQDGKVQIDYSAKNLLDAVKWMVVENYL